MGLTFTLLNPDLLQGMCVCIFCSAGHSVSQNARRSYLYAGILHEILISDGRLHFMYIVTQVLRNEADAHTQQQMLFDLQSFEIVCVAVFADDH
jgi:hypothetical protein